jgi:heterodisulfide reductase subunit A-like polyferredoxin
MNWKNKGRGGDPQILVCLGLAGLKSALELAERGLAVALLEKSPFWGDRWRF